MSEIVKSFQIIANIIYQKIIVKKIFRYQLSSETAFKTAKIQDIFSLIHCQTALYMYKIVKGISNEPVCKLIYNNQPQATYTFTTRYQYLLKKPQYTLNQVCKCISWRGLDTWNSLPVSLMSIDSLCTFKKAICEVDITR